MQSKSGEHEAQVALVKLQLSVSSGTTHVVQSRIYARFILTCITYKRWRINLQAVAW